MNMATQILALGAAGVAVGVPAQHPTPASATWPQHPTLGLVRVDWPVEPTSEQHAAAVAAISAHDPQSQWLAALAARCHALAAEHVARWFVGQVPVQLLLWRLDPAHAGNATLQTRLAAVQTWMEATQARSLTLAAQAQAGTLSAVAPTDFDVVGDPPYVLTQLLEAAHGQ